MDANVGIWDVIRLRDMQAIIGLTNRREVTTRT